MKQLRLHYCHGLESGPGGYKVRAMQEWAASVSCVDQEMSLANPLKRNSIVRSLAATLLTSWPSDWASTAFSKSLEQCAQVQRIALASGERPDVLVASSWGGAVALKLLADGSFIGPSVLLCPAYRAPEHWAGALGIERLRAETDATGKLAQSPPTNNKQEPQHPCVCHPASPQSSAWVPSTPRSRHAASSCMGLQTRPSQSRTRESSLARPASGWWRSRAAATGSASSSETAG